jgi:Domain of unknown function (DUF4177)
MFKRFAGAVLLALLISICLAWSFRSASAQTPKGPARWEYKVVDGGELMELAAKRDDKSWQNALTQIGEDGWELVSVVNTGDIRWFYFKRPKA